MSDLKINTEQDIKANSTESNTGFFDLTSNQIESLAKTAAKETIEETWATGLPITIEVEGKMCKKYSDGKIEWL